LAVGVEQADRERAVDFGERQWRRLAVLGRGRLAEDDRGDALADGHLLGGPRHALVAGEQRDLEFAGRRAVVADVQVGLGEDVGAEPQLADGAYLSLGILTEEEPG